ncbi:helix-turn-helix transcriptional regulator [Pseudomonas aeruginosa]
MPFQRTIRRYELRLVVPLAESTIYEMERRGGFPQRLNLTPRCVVWDLAEVKAWIEERKRAPWINISKPDFYLRKTRPVRAGSNQALSRHRPHPTGACSSLDTGRVSRRSSLATPICDRGGLPPRTPPIGWTHWNDMVAWSDENTVNSETAAQRIRQQLLRQGKPRASL